jgi:hypothetical protein
VESSCPECKGFVKIYGHPNKEAVFEFLIDTIHIFIGTFTKESSIS